jgi:hypothetical protein
MSTYTAAEVADYLTGRAASYGGDLQDILDETPVSLWDSPTELMTFWENRDLSHIFPQSEFPELADVWSNIIPEDPSDNRARGDDIMSSEDVVVAEYNNEEYADILDDEIIDDSTEFLEELLELV